MAKSKNKKGHAKKARHNRLMLDHNRHTQEKLRQQMIDNMIKAAKESPNNVAEMLNEEENISVGMETANDTVDFSMPKDMPDVHVEKIEA